MSAIGSGLIDILARIGSSSLHWDLYGELELFPSTREFHLPTK